MTNEDRADNATVALEAFSSASLQGSGYPDEPVLDRARDLITNLCHLLRSQGVEDISGEVLKSVAMFEIEEAEDD